MGAAGALELAGNLPSFDDLVVHPTINVDELDPQCDIPGLVINQPKATWGGGKEAQNALLRWVHQR